jgi:hypothetical protein
MPSPQETETLAKAADDLSGYITNWSTKDQSVGQNEDLRRLVADLNRALKPWGLG